MRKTVLLWLRRDLRLSDNPALRRAVDEAGSVIPVYIDTREEEGEWAPGAASRWWLHRSLAALAGSLGDKDSRLVIRRGKAKDVLGSLLEETGAEAVYWNRLYDPQLVERDKAVKSWLKKERGVEAASENAALLLEPWELETQAGDPYKVFTPFWRRALEKLPPPEPQRAPSTLRPPDGWPDSLGLDALGLLPERDWAGKFPEHWTPGEEGARRRFNAFLDGGILDYDEKRDLPGVDGVSRLSPHLHFGEISPRYIWHRAMDRYGRRYDGVDTYLRELGWREFAHHVLFHFPHTPTEPLQEKFADFPWRDDTASFVKAWRKGRTGFPIVDAGMRELWATGWMHNRVRMIVGSLLVKNVRAHWLTGARWFWDTLVDADLANNTMGWQWTGGCGADAAPYFRIFNPVSQSRKFDAEGKYIRRWVPELRELPDEYVHEPWKLPEDERERLGFRPGETYPKPIVDLKRSREEALEAFGEI